MNDQTNTKPTIEQMADYLNISPFQRWLGLEIKKLTETGLEISMPWRAEIVGLPEPRQVVHVGYLLTISKYDWNQ